VLPAAARSLTHRHQWHGTRSSGFKLQSTPSKSPKMSGPSPTLVPTYKEDLRRRARADTKNLGLPILLRRSSRARLGVRQVRWRPGAAWVARLGPVSAAVALGFYGVLQEVDVNNNPGHGTHRNHHTPERNVVVWTVQRQAAPCTM